MEYTIIKADLDKDKKTIISFWKTNFPLWSEKKYDWFYTANPEGMAECWLIRVSNRDEVVGTTAIFPRKFQYNNKEILAGITGDFGVDKNHRILGPAIKLQKAVVASEHKTDIQFIYGYPNRHSEPVQKRAGFRIVGNSLRMVKPLASQKYIRRFVKVDILSTLLAKGIDFALRFFSKEMFSRRNNDLRLVQLSYFDERFDGLWEEASQNYIFVGKRNSHFLNWRFVDCPSQKYHLVALESTRSKNILGYIVYYFKNKVVNIADFFALDSKSVYQELLIGFIKAMRKEKIGAIEITYFGNKKLTEYLQSFGFSIRDDERKIVAFTNSTSPLFPELFEESNWYFTEADND